MGHFFYDQRNIPAETGCYYENLYKNVSWSDESNIGREFRNYYYNAVS